MDTTTERLRWLRERENFQTRREAAEAYGVNYDIYKKLTADESPRPLTRKHAARIAAWHGVSVGWLMFGEGLPEGKDRVVVQGSIGAGQEMVEFEDMSGHGRTVSTVIAGPDAAAFEIKGDSMLPLARDRDIVFFGRPHRSAESLRRLVGRECAVRLADGRRFFKVLEHGSRLGAFDLHSYNAEPIRNVEVFEAGPFLGLRRAR
jgi:hypothetical protein